MSAATALSLDVGKKPACKALGMPRATFYRHGWRAEAPETGDTCRPNPPLALSLVERQEVTADQDGQRTSQTGRQDFPDLLRDGEGDRENYPC